jgi:hypothetical protein
LLYANRRVLLGTDDNGKPLTKDAVPWWLKHNERCGYTGGILFRPSGQVAADEYNLWRGFAVTPRTGDYPKFKDHLQKVTCAGDSSLFDYLWGWMAYAVQHPDKQGHVAVVIVGEEGAGKSIVGEIFGRLFGQHAFTVSHAKHLTGAFNLHLRDCVFLHCEEVFHGGDKAAESVLRYLITSPTLVIEGKGQNAIVAPNCLHIMMTANPGWVVPASLGARRFLVLQAGNQHIRDFKYFTALVQEMDAGGYEALLHDLLHHDLSNFNVRDVPTTAGLIEQKKLSLEPHMSWWSNALHRGFVFDSKLGLGAHFTQWIDPISMDLLYASYLEHARLRHERHPLSREDLGKFLTSVGGEGKRLRNLVIGEHMTDVDTGNGFVRRQAELLPKLRAYGYAFGDLAEAQRKFDEKTGLLVDWGRDEAAGSDDDEDEEVI